MSWSIFLLGSIILLSSSTSGAPAHKPKPIAQPIITSGDGIPVAWNHQICPSYAQIIATPAPLHDPRDPCAKSTKDWQDYSRIQSLKLFDNTIRWFSTDKNITETYIISGDITSEWLRDSTNQVNVYLPLIDSDKPLKQLILGVINLQAKKFITEGTYCNGFNPPKESNIAIQSTPGVAQSASETPLASLCNLGVDGLASFLTLSNRFHSVTNETTFVTPTWLKAVELSLQVFENESGATSVSIGSNTGKPDSSVPAVNEGARHPQAYTGLVGTRLRPSNEPVIFPYNVPVNAMISVQTSQLQKLLTSAPLSPPSLKRRAAAISQNINKALNVHAVTTHPIWGKIYAYELDGFGSTAIMDDAAIPSLLSLPYIGWESLNSTIFKTTRRLLTSPDGNPFFFNGTSGFGIGSSHTGADKIWPMSLISLLFSSESAEEIESIIQILIDSTQGYGVLHESFDAFKPEEFTRTWFAWVNSYFAEAILYLAEINPGTIFKDSQPILLTSQGNLAWYGGLRH
ncbi:hypothetical protein H4Q26_000808 [Puccinia striiformis f. sp. tritici PST-130]|nr:hypothetical protein H4Q26_000808 [Puccinia striiformis f. sp. tritici PST-130]